MRTYPSHFLRWAVRLVVWPGIGIGVSSILIGPMSVVAALLYFCFVPAVLFRPFGFFNHEFMAPQTYVDFTILVAFWLFACGLLAAFSYRGSDHKQEAETANSPVNTDQPSAGPLP